MATNKDCIFCRIVRAEIPSYKIYEDDKFLAILDIARFVEGHTIVIPKDHFETIWDVPNIGEYYAVIQKIGNHYKSLGYKYVDTLSFGRMVLHSHVHLVPHSGDKNWSAALKGVHEMQLDTSRHPTPEEGANLVAKFKLPR